MKRVGFEEIIQFIPNGDKYWPFLKSDNLLFREKGIEAWAMLQNERREKGFVYGDMGE